MVGVHVPHDRRRHRVHPLLHRGGQRLHPDALRRAVRGRRAHGHRAVRHHAGARLRAPEPLPQRHLHRHHGPQDEAHRGAAGEPERGRQHQQQRQRQRHRGRRPWQAVIYGRVHRRRLCC